MSNDLVKLYYRIGEVADIVGVQPHVLRYWESEFRTIRPQKSSKGQRVYSKRDVERLLHVKDLLRNQGFTIAGAKRRLREENLGHGKVVPAAPNESATQTEGGVPPLRLVPGNLAPGNVAAPHAGFMSSTTASHSGLAPSNSTAHSSPALSSPALHLASVNLSPGQSPQSASSASAWRSNSDAAMSSPSSMQGQGLTQGSLASGLTEDARADSGESPAPSHWILPSRSSVSGAAGSRFQAVSDVPDVGSDARALRRGLLAVREELALWVGEIESDREN